jgi:Protein of unknown function (DUF3553)
LNLLPGMYVTHAKMPQLGSGEILAEHEGRVCIRFATGNRDFVLDLVRPHLNVTSEAPAAAQKAAKRSRKAAVKKLS